MTTTEDPTLRQKLDAIIRERREANFRCATGQASPPSPTVLVPLTEQELQSLTEMLREDEPPDTTGVLPGLYSVTLVACGTRYSVTGAGIHNRYDVPVFERESDAASMCRCLSLTFQAGQRQRSRQIMQLLREGR